MSRKLSNKFLHGIVFTNQARKISISPYIEAPHVEYSDTRGDNHRHMRMDDFYRFADGPDTYYQFPKGLMFYQHDRPFHFYYGKASIPELTVAYETWGELNEDKSNAVLIFTGRSANSHAKKSGVNSVCVVSNLRGNGWSFVVILKLDQRNHFILNMEEGWWEHMIGKGKSIDTDKYFVICANQLASCYGTTGPSTLNPTTRRPYGSDFPVCSVKDMVDAQLLLLDYLGIEQLDTTVGSSLGGKCSLALSAIYPHRTKRIISISACAQSHPSSIALRYLQRRCIMEDENWNGGHYYGNVAQFKGANYARSVTTLGDRRGKEWTHRFGRSRVNGNSATPTLGIDFEIESYMEYVGRKLASSFDPNSLLYISKAMDLFDLSEWFGGCIHTALHQIKCKTLIMGVRDDFVVPVWQQRELATLLEETGNKDVKYKELKSEYGHSSFLLDKNEFSTTVRDFMDSE